MIFKKLSLFVTCIVLVFLFLVSCDSTKIPKITNVDEMSAKNLLSSNGLIPAVVYEYNDNIVEGCVIKTYPAIGTSVKKNSVVTIYISKGSELKVPDIANVDEDTAKKVLTSNQLIPSITYEYSDTIIVGNVTRTEPEIGSVVEPNSKITVYLSYGPSYVEASNVTIEDGEGTLKSCTVYRNGDKLYIECKGFNYNMNSVEAVGEWDDPNNTGRLYGVASLTSNYYNSVPLSGKYPQKTWEGYDRQDFTIEISLLELGTDKPTMLYFTLHFALKIGSWETTNTDFCLAISW